MHSLFLEKRKLYESLFFNKISKREIKINYTKLDKLSIARLSSYLFLLNLFLQVRCEEPLILLLLLSWQVAETFNVPSAIWLLTHALWHVINTPVGHCIIVSHFLSRLDISKSNVRPISSIKTNSTIRIARMVDTPAQQSKEYPLVHVDLAGV